MTSLSSTEPPWAPLAFLVGTWEGEGGGVPGEGRGAFTFAPDLQERILVRTSYAEYPATTTQAAFRHDDLLVVYSEPEGGALRAVYFDNEGHVIHYAVATPDPRTVAFVGDPTAPGPRFRLTYVASDADRVELTFDIAPPGAPDAFAPYITSRARRSSRR